MAQGRVWSGVEAKNLGLVDELGTLDDAIVAAAELAEIESYGVKKYPKYKTGFEKFMEDMSSVKSGLGQSLIKEEIGLETYDILRQLKSTMEQKGIQARMPFVLDIK
jgi:protease-4